MSRDGIDMRPFEAFSTQLKLDPEEFNESERDFNRQAIYISPTLVSSLLTSLKYAGLTRDSCFSRSISARGIGGKDKFLEVLS